MRRLVLPLLVLSIFSGLGISTLSASVIEDGIILASNDKCGGEKKRPITGSCGDSKCGDEDTPRYKKEKHEKCGDEGKEYKYDSSRCGSENKREEKYMMSDEKRCGS